VSVRRFTSQPIPIPEAGRALPLERADLVVDGLDQAGPSFEARVFVDNPGADEHTPPDPANGYVGSIHVYGYGLPPDDPAAPPPGAGSRAPMRRTLPATELMRGRVDRGDPMVVTVVAVPYQGSAEDLDVDLSPLRAWLEVNQPPAEA
jgi:hypothetical protein